MASKLRRFTVIHEEPGVMPFEYFQCWADDSDHAEEQCVNAYPGNKVLWVNEGDNVSMIENTFMCAHCDREYSMPLVKCPSDDCPGAIKRGTMFISLKGEIGDTAAGQDIETGPGALGVILDDQVDYCPESQYSFVMIDTGVTGYLSLEEITDEERYLILPGSIKHYLDAMRCAEVLTDAYGKGEFCGSVDWDDVNRAHVHALAACLHP